MGHETRTSDDAGEVVRERGPEPGLRDLSSPSLLARLHTVGPPWQHGCLPIDAP